MVSESEIVIAVRDFICEMNIYLRNTTFKLFIY